MRQALLKLALAVFVIVTLSAVGGVIRGGKVAGDAVANIAAPLYIFSTTLEFEEGTIPGITKKGTVMGEMGEVVSVFLDNESNDQIEYEASTGYYYLYEDGGELKGPYNELDQEVISAKRKVNGIINTCDNLHDPACSGEPLFTTSSSDDGQAYINFKVEEKKENKESYGNSDKEVMGDQNKALVIEQGTHTEDNRCSTTYVTNGAEVDCYNKGGDKANKAIKALATCIAGNTTKGVDATARAYEMLVPALNKGMCMGEEAKIVKTSPRSNALLNEKPLVVYPIVAPSIPTACKRQYDVVIGMMGGLNGSAAARKSATSATLADANTCAWKGAVVCFSSVGSNTLTCKKKSDIRLEKLSSTNTPPPAKTGCSGNAAKKIQCYIQGVFKDPNKRKSIAKGFLNGLKQVFSKKKGDSSNIPEPQCLIEASKSGIKEGEQVSIRWKTANTTSVSIEGIEGDVSKTGLKVVSPTQTTTYKLIAIGGGNKRKECQTTVEVTKTNEGPTGAYPPTLSCLPKLIKKEEPATIEWSCPSNSDGSEGIGIDTNNELEGRVSISPNNNSNYSVKCLLEGEEIGGNTCAVSVGNPLYDIISYPASVKEGEQVKITWASLFMSSCRVEGPRGFDYTSSHGVVITEPFEVGVSGSIASANYDLTCRTQFGDLVSKEIEVSKN